MGLSCQRHLQVTFDNSYSMFRGKTFEYRLTGEALPSPSFFRQHLGFECAPWKVSSCLDILDSLGLTYCVPHCQSWR